MRSVGEYQRSPEETRQKKLARRNSPEEKCVSCAVLDAFARFGVWCWDVSRHRRPVGHAGKNAGAAPALCPLARRSTTALCAASIVEDRVENFAHNLAQILVRDRAALPSRHPSRDHRTTRSHRSGKSQSHSRNRTGGQAAIAARVARQPRCGFRCRDTPRSSRTGADETNGRSSTEIPQGRTQPNSSDGPRVGQQPAHHHDQPDVAPGRLLLYGPPKRRRWRHGLVTSFDPGLPPIRSIPAYRRQRRQITRCTQLSEASCKKPL
jgi:hypothetical protein